MMLRFRVKSYGTENYSTKLTKMEQFITTLTPNETFKALHFSHLSIKAKL